MQQEHDTAPSGRPASPLSQPALARQLTAFFIHYATVRNLDFPLKGTYPAEKRDEQALHQFFSRVEGDQKTLELLITMIGTEGPTQEQFDTPQGQGLADRIVTAVCEAFPALQQQFVWILRDIRLFAEGLPTSKYARLSAV